MRWLCTLQRGDHSSAAGRDETALTGRIAKILAAAIAFGFGLETSFAPGMMPGVMSEAFAFGHGGSGGGGHFGGGNFGGFWRRSIRQWSFRPRPFRWQALRRRTFRWTAFRRQPLWRWPFWARKLGWTPVRWCGRPRWRTAFAHNGFSGREFGRFNGVRGFDAHEFNRNAFGNMDGWNAWGNNYWGAGWNDWGSGWGYWAGPVFWPFFFGDALTFALWPYAFYDPFFAYGPDLLLTSIFWPGPSFSPYYAYNPYYYRESPYSYGENSLFNIYGNAPYANGYAYSGYGGRDHRRHHRLYAAHSVARGNLEGDSNSALTCGGLAPGVVSLPIDQIERAIRPTDAQVAMLDDLKAASAQADNILRSSCPTEVPLTPIARLDSVEKRIQAMSQAVQILRPPLTTLYNSLDDEQKDRFAAIGAQTKYRRARIAREESPASNLGGLCKQQTENFTQLPVQRIKELIEPTEQQNAAFDALKSASAKAAADLDASCPADIPQTLTVRLDAVGKRLDALADAVNTVRPALADFYNSLTDEQKARFNVIGRASPAATPQGETKSGG